LKKLIFVKNFYRLIINRSKIKIIKKFLFYSFEYYKNKKQIIKYNNNQIKLLIKNKRVSELWFSRNIYFLDKVLNKISQYNKKNILEIGSFEGVSSLYFLNKFKNCSLTCVDPFTGSDEHEKHKNNYNLEENFDYNLIDYRDRYKKIKKYSYDFFKSNEDKYDLIYIDGSHRFEDVYGDAVQSNKFLNSNGLLIFDDFFWTFYEERLNPMAAINKFLKKFNNNYEVVYLSQQLILRKKS